MTDVDCTDDIAHVVNTPDQAECLQHNQEQAARGSGFYMNSDETEFMCFTQD